VARTAGSTSGCWRSSRSEIVGFIGTTCGREDELSILDSLYRVGSDAEFKPFYHKASDFAFEEHRRFFESVVRDADEHLFAFRHQHQGTRDTEQVEAVHAALTTHELDVAERDTLVLLDGGQPKGETFVRAYEGAAGELPAVVHCQRAELYYPTALLADLTANYLAHRFAQGVLVGEALPVSAPFAKQVQPEWGAAYNGLYESDAEYKPESLPVRRGERVRERVRCWYDGAVATHGNASRPATDSINPVVHRLRDAEYEQVATTLSRL